MANLREERELQLSALALLPNLQLQSQYRRAMDLAPSVRIPIDKSAVAMIREILLREFPPLVP